MRGDTSQKWIVCQIGARENYAIARAIYRKKLLQAMITDLWFERHWPVSLLKGRIFERYHKDLPGPQVCESTGKFLAWETFQRVQSSSGWSRIIKRNQLFQRVALEKLENISRSHKYSNFTLFAYSYAARDLLSFAKSKGWKTILGQIDPGPAEAALVETLQRSAGQYRIGDQAPTDYWENWYEEVESADLIVANSSWSVEGLCSKGVDRSKIRVVPLAYHHCNGSNSFRRSYPRAFSPTRPLVVLFLGQVNTRKGVIEIFDAIDRVRDLPIHFHFVGEVQVDIPNFIRGRSDVLFFGSVERSSVHHFYKGADVFLFPTHSDGFGLTQLEAMSWSLPVIASSNCGEVVRDGENGIVLRQISGNEIESALRRVFNCPELIHRLSSGASQTQSLEIDGLGERLLELV